MEGELDVVVREQQPIQIEHDDVNVSTESNEKFDGKEIDICKLVVKEDLIGQGTYGCVFRGFYDDQIVAVKLIQLADAGRRTKEVKDSLYKEIALWSVMDHPNITKFVGAAEIRDNQSSSTFCYLVSEYLLGGSLRSLLKRKSKTKLPFKKVIKIALDMAKGLTYLHSQNIIHRDVKTQNMLVDTSGTVKVADFGLSRVKASEGEGDMTGVTGTLGYMAPEVLEGKQYDTKSDVYSFGFCLCEIYCCDVPYQSESFADVTSAILNKNFRPKIPRCCPKSLAKLMKKCWSADPMKRPDMKDVVSALEAIDTSKGCGMTPCKSRGGCFCFF